MIGVHSVCFHDEILSEVYNALVLECMQQTLEADNIFRTKNQLDKVYYL